MKIGDTVFVIVNSDGRILGDGDSLLISESRELLEEELDPSRVEYLESMNKCSRSEMRIEKVTLYPGGLCSEEAPAKTDPG